MSTPAQPEVSKRLFVGRGRDLAELRAALERAGNRRGSLVLVTGEAGVGKTRLLEELTGGAAHHGWTVLVGHCWEQGGAPAYWPWIPVVRAAGGELERLAPDARTGVDPEGARFALFEAVTQFVLGAARKQPLLIVMDDLHAADAPSLLLLRFLAGEITSSPVLVVGSYRDREPRVRELRELFAELVRVGQRITLRGLSPGHVSEYVAGLAGAQVPAAVVTRLHEITGGNPFFLGEIVRMLTPAALLHEPATKDLLLHLPEEVRTLIRRRVAGLSKDTVAALDVAAVVGREFDLRILQRTSGLKTARLMDSLAEAVAAGVLDGDLTPPRYGFVHELMRKTLYDDLPATRRLELHLTIGSALEDLHRDDLEPHLSEIAHHLSLAAPLGEPQRAVDYLFGAGDRASAVLAYEEAAVHYGQALDLLSGIESSGERRCALLVRLGDARWRAGDARGARQSLEASINAARRLGAAELLARAALSYVTALGGFVLSARFEAGATGADVLSGALAMLPPGDSPLRSRLLARLAVEGYSARSPVEDRVALSTEALEMARRLGDSEALVTALHAHQWVLATPDRVLDRPAYADELLRVAQEIGNTELAFLAHNARFHCCLELCDGAGLDAEIAAMTGLAQLMRQPFYVWHTAYLRTVRATLDGRLAEAERLAREALEGGGLRHSEYAGYVSQYAQAFAVHWAQGRIHEIWEAIEHHGERFPWIPRWRDAIAAAELGDVAAAHREIDRHGAHGFRDLPRDGLWLLHLCGLAEACVLVGDQRHGEELYELLVPFADRNAVSYTQQPFGPVALRLGMLAAMLGRPADAERHFTTALQCCELLGARAISARVLVEHARLLVGLGDRARARAMLDQAEAICEELGLSGIRDRVHELRDDPTAGTATLRREGDFWTVAYAGETSRVRDVKGLHYLASLLATPAREVHVLELLSAVHGPPAGSFSHPAPDEVAAGWPSDTGPVLDQQAKHEYRRRLKELDDEVEEARSWRDVERAARAQEELDFLTSELARAVGLGGRDREVGSTAERARISVTKAIKTAIRLLEANCPALGEHLATSVRTGRFCCYAPPGQVPPPWNL
jgi:eukaryotic-like serine/threonine-protein kinase